MMFILDLDYILEIKHVEKHVVLQEGLLQIWTKRETWVVWRGGNLRNLESDRVYKQVIVEFPWSGFLASPVFGLREEELSVCLRPTCWRPVIRILGIIDKLGKDSVQWVEVKTTDY